MTSYLIARDNRMTGERGLMDAMEWTEGGIVDRTAISLAAQFPLKVATRAERFEIVKADSRDELLRRFGPEIE